MKAIVLSLLLSTLSAVALAKEDSAVAVTSVPIEKKSDKPTSILEKPIPSDYHEQSRKTSYRRKFCEGGKKIFGNQKRNLIGSVALIIAIIIGYFVRKK